jgi:uncharacterized protein (TIGR00369 family)
MEELPSDVVGLVDKVIVRSSYAALLGMELVDAAEGRVRVKLPYRADLTTYGDTVHGGAISALIDVAATACFWASRSVAAGAQGATIGFTVNFTSAARGKDLVATAQVRRRGLEISTAEVSVRDPDDKEVALALVTYKLSSRG